MLGALDKVGEAVAGAVRASESTTALAVRGRPGIERAAPAPAGKVPAGAIQDGASLMPSGSAPARRSSRQFLREYSNMPWLRAISSRIAFDVAATTWQIYAVKPSGAQRYVRPRALQRMAHKERRTEYARLRAAGELTEIEVHPLLDLIANPNPLMEGLTARKVSQLWIDINGAAHWLLERGLAGIPVRAWPIPPHWIVEYPTAQRQSFMCNFPNWTGEIPASEFVSFVDVDPADPYSGRGSGAFYAAADELELDEYAAKHAKGVFFNRARPDIIVTAEGASEVEMRRFERNWLSKAQGLFKQWRPLFASRKIDVHEVSQSFQQLEFGRLRDQERDIILHTIGMPPEVLGIIENSNRSTIDAADYLYAGHLLVPRLELLRSVFQERVAPLYDDRIVVEYVSPIAEDREFTLKVAQAAPWSRTVRQWQELGGITEQDDEDGLDVYMIPATLFAQDTPGGARRPAPVTPAPVTPAPLPGDAQPTDPVTPPPAASTRPAVTRALDPRIAALYRIADGIADHMTDEYVGTVETHARGVDEGALVSAITSGGIEAAVQACNLDALARALWGPRYGASPFEEQDGELLRSLAAALEAGGTLASEELAAAGITLAFDVANTYAVAWAEQHAAELVQQVSAGQRETIRQIVEDGIANRDSPADIAREVRQVIGLTDRQAAAVSNYRRSLIADGRSAADVEELTGQYAARTLRNRGETIARTESLGAANNGQRLLWEAGVRGGLLGADVQREWITAEDDRVEHLCAQMDRVKAKIGEPFHTPKGDLQAPPLHPRCRCAVVIAL